MEAGWFDMDDLIVLPELLTYLPGTPKATDESLERSLLASGRALDPIKVWKGRGIIVDGHRRYALCQKLRLPYEIQEIEFADLDAVKAWMDLYQSCRRNLDSLQLAVVIDRIVERKKASGEIKIGRGAIPGNMVAAKQSIAKELGVSERTVHRAVETAKALKTLPEDVKLDVEALPGKKTQAAVQKLAALPPEEQREVIQAVKNGDAINLSKAVTLDARTERASTSLGQDSQSDSVSDSNPFSKKKLHEVVPILKAAEQSLGQFNKQLERLKKYDLEKYVPCRNLLEDLCLQLDEWKKSL